MTLHHNIITYGNVYDLYLCGNHFSLIPFMKLWQESILKQLIPNIRTDIVEISNQVKSFNGIN